MLQLSRSTLTAMSQNKYSVSTIAQRRTNSQCEQAHYFFAPGNFIETILTFAPPSYWAFNSIQASPVNAGGSIVSSKADARLKNVGDTFGYWLVEALRWTLSWMPRVLARRVVGSIAWCVYSFHGKIRRTGEERLSLALPEFDARERRIFLRGMYRHLGWQVVEFCRMPRYTVRNTIGRCTPRVLTGFANCAPRGKGVLHPDEPSGRLGTDELLPLVKRPSHEHGCSTH